MAASVQSIVADPNPTHAPLAPWRAVLAFVGFTYALSWSIWAGGWLLTGHQMRLATRV